MTFTGTRLRLQRQRLGLSQAGLAELTGVAQHQLSAFELGKIALPAAVLDAVRAALADTARVAGLTTRAKRYRQHEYRDMPPLPERAGRARRSDGNLDYRRCLDQLAAGHVREKTAGLSALSLFSGCGGFSLGFSAAGFAVKGYLELQAPLRDIYRLNFPDALELGGDITAIDADTLRAFQRRLGAVDLIIGGPPCQGFSLSGKRAVDDPRNRLFEHYLRFVEVFRPRMVVLENVRLLTSMKNPQGSLVRDDISAAFRRHGYKVEWFELNAKDHGVPQHRERVIFVAVRHDVPAAPSLPAAGFGPAADLLQAKRPYRTFADACSDLPFIESGGKSADVLHEAVRHPAHVIDWLWDVPQGRSAHDNDDPAKRPPSGYNTTYKRQLWDEPAATVQTTFGMISGCRNVHPIATRSLSIREAARIQSFPDSFRFSGSLGAIRTGIGNAVPPLLAYRIACHARKLLNPVEVPGLEVEL